MTSPKGVWLLVVTVYFLVACGIDYTSGQSIWGSLQPASVTDAGDVDLSADAMIIAPNVDAMNVDVGQGATDFGLVSPKPDFGQGAIDQGSISPKLDTGINKPDSGINKPDSGINKPDSGSNLPSCVPKAEICDGKDNDCDSVIDDGASSSCSNGKTCQLGVCASPSAIQVTVNTTNKQGGKIQPIWAQNHIAGAVYATDRNPTLVNQINPIIDMTNLTPFFTEATISMAMGGYESKSYAPLYPTKYDLYNNGNYNFAPLKNAIDNTIAAGVKPHFTLGSIPEALSTDPKPGIFGYNMGAPKDYFKYYDFIKAMFNFLAATYTKQTVESWGFDLLGEPENTDSWLYGFEEYKDLYDFTLAGMRAAKDPSGNSLNPTLNVGHLFGPTDLFAVTQNLGLVPWHKKMANINWWTTTNPKNAKFATNFTNGNMGGWIKHSGDVSAHGGILDVYKGIALSSVDLGRDYQMSVKMQTVVPGPNVWNVGWILIRYQNDQDLYRIGLHTSGWLEFSKQNSSTWLASAKTNLDPQDPHKFRITVVGRVITVDIYEGTEYKNYIKYTVPNMQGAMDGKIGIHASDARVYVDDVEITSIAAAHEGALPRSPKNATQGRLSFSCYSCGQMGLDPREFKTLLNDVKNKYSDFTNYHVSETGMMCVGDGRHFIASGEGTELGASWYAAMFKIALDNGLERLQLWDLFHAYYHLKSASYNVIDMYEKLRTEQIGSSAKSDRLQVQLSKTVGPKDSYPYLDAIAAKHSSGKVSLIVFNYNHNVIWKMQNGSLKYNVNNVPSENVVVLLQNLAANGKYKITHYRMDKDHSNFVAHWLKYVQAQHLEWTYDKTFWDGQTWQDGSFHSSNVAAASNDTGKGQLSANGKFLDWYKNKWLGFGRTDGLENLTGNAPQTKNASASGSMTLGEFSFPPNSVSYIELVPVP